uniref:DNA polymerase delta subunit 3 n=1 Tax=Steinernema glaseri TaxID=37863 RepID=A0A1I7XVZ6_9BILA
MSSTAPVFERPPEEVAAKEAEVFAYLEREVIEKERCVTYKEVATNVDYFYIEVAKAVKKFYEANKDRDGLTATFNVCGVKWLESEQEFEDRRRSDPEATRRCLLRNMLATEEELKEFKEEVDEIRQQMVYSVQFAKNFQNIEALLKEDEKLLSSTDDIEKWFRRCWWRRGDPEKCRQEMLASGALDLHKVASNYAPVLSRGPAPNPNKPVKKPKVEEQKPDKKISALFAKACAREKHEEPDKNKHIKKSPMKPVKADEKEEVLQKSPLFKKMARSRIRIDSESEEEETEKKQENKTPSPPKNASGFDMSKDLFSTGSPSPQKMEVDEEPEPEEKKPKSKKKAEKSKKAKRDIFEAKEEEPKTEAKPSTSRQAEDEGPKVVKTKQLDHETYVDEDGFLVTVQKTVMVQKDPSEEPPKVPFKRSNAVTPSSGAPPAKKKATGQSKISSFFGAPKK